MVWPAPSLRPSMLIETPVAAPVTTTWNDSNSFFAAEIFAAAVEPAGGCMVGRTFCAAGAIQTWAAARRIGNKVPPWLSACRNDGVFLFRLANEGGLPLLPWVLCRSVRRTERASGDQGVVRVLSYKAVQRLQRPHRARIRVNCRSAHEVPLSW